MLLSSAPQQAPFRARWAALVSLGAGLLGVLAFPRFGVWPLAFLSVALFSIAVQGRRSRAAAWIGFVYGIAFFCPLLSWTGIYVGPVPWLILAFAEAGFFAAMGAVLVLVQRLRGAAFWVATVWVLQEAIRDRAPFGGFPWGRLAFSQAESPMRWLAAVGGAPLVSFGVALGGAGLASALLNARHRRWVGIAPGVALLVAVPGFAAILSVPLAPAPDHSGATTTIAVIQGNVPDRGLEFNARRRQVLDNHVTQTLKLAAEIKAGTVARPELVVWPENSSDIDPFDNADAYAQITKAVEAVGVPILVGAILDGPGPNHDRNVGILWSPTTGPGASYTKRHPVPFAEYIPLRSIARLVSSDVDLVQRDMVKGGGNGLLSGGPYPLGDVICFEVAYDDLVRSSVRAGAQLLVVQTNNATFGHTAETYQQLAMTQLRAVEHGRTVVQVATSGLSAIIGPDGRIRQRSGALFTPSILDASVPLRTSLTLADRLQDGPEYALAGLAALAAIASVLAVRRTRTSAAVRPGDDNEHSGDQPPAENEEMVTA
jgi:apolipoprotein N-acyltransferase